MAADLPGIYVSPPDQNGARQINALLPSGMHPGNAMVQLVVDEQASAGMSVRLV
ncbi:MAG: hypothetical protein HYZ57_20335 [Acidobacteria bacterium]|nr:hypothetical protein [Acidobacteriota bacterium]MBI3282175.1 hypothetical protein [Acidobacteriota bacterium]